MSTASVTNTFVNLTAADATEVNANFTDVISFLNDGVVHRDGSKAMAADLDLGTNQIINVGTGSASTDAVNKAQMDAAIAAAVDDGAWTSWTPTVTQSGSVTVTNGGSRYCRIGRTIHFTFVATVTGSGTGNNAIFMAVPVAEASGAIMHGSGFIVDASNGFQYIGMPRLSAGAFVMLDVQTTNADQRLGLTSSTFSGALASGDYFEISGTYEAAS